jgi:ribosomal protein S18 acetylase RimI-like enzyme
LIRKIKQEETDILKDFLYEAIFVPEGAEAPPKDIVNQPELQVYIESFGNNRGDICFVEELDGRIVGAAWTRLMDDYGHIKDNCPSWAISLYKEYRGQGIGTALMRAVLGELKRQGYQQTSLSVQKENPAWHLYKRMGFEIIKETDQEYIMAADLKV